MHQGHQSRLATTLERGLHLVRGKHISPLGFHDDRLRPTALDDIDHTAAEDTVNPDYYLITRFNQVYQTGFHASTASAGNRQSEGILGLEDKPQQIFGLVHQPDELRVEVPYKGRGQRLEHARVDITRTWAQQDTSGRSKLTSSFHDRPFLQGRRKTALTLPRTDLREKRGAVGQTLRCFFATRVTV